MKVEREGEYFMCIIKWAEWFKQVNAKNSLSL